MNPRHLLLIPLIVTAGACTAIGPDYEPPTPDVSAGWSADGPFDAQPIDERRPWWTALDDPHLDTIVDRGLKESPDLLAAAQRIRRAAAIRARNVGERFPDLDGDGSYSRNRSGANDFPALPDAESFDTFSLGAGFAWELDLWGRVSRLIEAADADLGVAVEEREDLRRILSAAIVSEYLDLKTALARQEVTRRNIAGQRESLTIAQARVREGAAPALDLAQARRNLANTEATLPRLLAAERSSRLTLAALIGLDPGRWSEIEIGESRLPAVPDRFAVGIPANAIRARPDIRSAERTLAGEVARIGVELGDLYPRFQLGGSLSASATDAGRWFDGKSIGFGLGPSFTWNLFDGGRELSDVEAQRAGADIALYDYRQRVIDAVQEVESAMYSHARERDRASILRRSVSASRESTRLSRELYLEGESDFQNLLDAERSQFEAEDDLIATAAEVVRTFIDVQRALGASTRTPLVTEPTTSEETGP